LRNFILKSQTVAEKIAKNFVGLLFLPHLVVYKLQLCNLLDVAYEYTCVYVDSLCLHTTLYEWSSQSTLCGHRICDDLENHVADLDSTGGFCQSSSCAKLHLCKL